MDAPENIPIVDFSALAINTRTDNCYNTPEVAALSEDIMKAFSQIGFVYLVNTGINQTQVDAVWDRIGEFFKLPSNIKEKYVRAEGLNYGWVDSENESLNPGTPGDLKETFNVTPQFSTPWPASEVPGLQGGVRAFWEQCQHLTTSLLRLLALSLKLKDVDYFIKCHNLDMRPSADDPVNQSALRFLHYPPVEHEVVPGQLRCGEHSDWGTITLLFQDQVGGLQVMSRNGSWVDATPISGSVLVNIGDMLQRWSADSLKSTRHRVVCTDPTRGRQSAAYFCNPDMAYVVEPFSHGSSVAYEPVTYGTYLNARIRESLHATLL